MKALATESRRHRGKVFFLFSVSLCLRGNFLSRQRRAFLFLHGLRVLRGSGLLCFLRHLRSREYAMRSGSLPLRDWQSAIHRREFLKLFHNGQKFCCGLYYVKKSDRMRRNEYQTDRYSNCWRGKSVTFLFTNQPNARGEMSPSWRQTHFSDSRKSPQRKLSASHATPESHCVFPVPLST